MKPKCDKCGEKFTPMSRWQTTCNDCYKKNKEEKDEKEN